MQGKYFVEKYPSSYPFYVRFLFCLISSYKSRKKSNPIQKTSNFFACCRKIFINIVDNENVVISRWHKFAGLVQAAARPEVVVAGEVAHRRCRCAFA
jgi:hypothetical protein